MLHTNGRASLRIDNKNVYRELGYLRVCWHQTSPQKEKALFVAFHVRVGCKLHHVKKETDEKQMHQLNYASVVIITTLVLLSPTPPPHPRP